jgi:hypothetical protein
MPPNSEYIVSKGKMNIVMSLFLLVIALAPIGHFNDDLAPGTLNSILKQAKLKEEK